MKTAARQKTKTTNMRGLKKADWEVDFLFMVEICEGGFCVKC